MITPNKPISKMTLKERKKLSKELQLQAVEEVKILVAWAALYFLPNKSTLINHTNAQVIKALAFMELGEEGLNHARLLHIVASIGYKQGWQDKESQGAQ